MSPFRTRLAASPCTPRRRNVGSCDWTMSAWAWTWALRGRWAWAVGVGVLQFLSFFLSSCTYVLPTSYIRSTPYCTRTAFRANRMFVKIIPQSCRRSLYNHATPIVRLASPNPTIQSGIVLSNGRGVWATRSHHSKNNYSNKPYSLFRGPYSATVPSYLLGR